MFKTSSKFLRTVLFSLKIVRASTSYPRYFCPKMMQIYNVVQNILCDIHFKPNKTFKFFILIEPDIHNSLSAFIIVFDIIPKTFRRRKQRHFKYMRYVMFLGDFLQTFPVNRMIDTRLASLTVCV